MRTGRCRCSLAAARAPGEWEASGCADRAVVTRSQPSPPISVAVARIRRSWPSSAGAGTAGSRARLRRRHSAGSVSKSTATAGMPVFLASPR